MYIGVTFPQTEIGADPAAIRDYAQAAEGLGYHHLVVFDHVLGADTTNRPGWKGYTTHQMFHEPFVLFGYLAALTRLELVTAVIILPQRQTALVAKQAAEVDVLTGGGRLRLGVGVGWNDVEYEALGMDFRKRGRAIEEQVEVLRLLWKQESVDYHGTFHTINAAGLNPLPPQRSIPIWLGGTAEVLLRRVASIGDGWFPQGKPDEQMRNTLDRLRGYIRDAGRNPAEVGIESRISITDGDLDELVRLTRQWQELGATHISINTMGAGFKSPAEHIDAIRRYKEALS